MLSPRPGIANENRPNGVFVCRSLVIQPDGLEIPDMDKAFAEHFAADWIDSWNSHDLDRVLSHYADDFEMTSPVIIQIDAERSGTLRGKAAVGRYWRKALELIPDLHFELIAVLAGVTSITLYYKGAGGRLAAEVLHFGAERRVTRSARSTMRPQEENLEQDFTRLYRCPSSTNRWTSAAPPHMSGPTGLGRGVHALPAPFFLEARAVICREP